jgi:hypothetical protein
VPHSPSKTGNAPMKAHAVRRPIAHFQFNQEPQLNIAS